MDKVTNDYNISSTFIANKKDIDNFARGYEMYDFLKVGDLIFLVNWYNRRL